MRVKGKNKKEGGVIGDCWEKREGSEGWSEGRREKNGGKKEEASGR